MGEQEKPSPLFVLERLMLGILITGLVLAGLYWGWLSPKETLVAALSTYGWLVTRATLNRVTEGVEEAGDKGTKGAIADLVGEKGPIAATLASSIANNDPKHQESKAKRAGRFILGAARLFLTGRL